MKYKMAILMLGVWGVSASMLGKEEEWKSCIIRVKSTAYCPCKLCCPHYSDGITATGRDAFLPGLAVDPSVIPLGSRVDIPGYKRGINKNGSWILADDIGRAIKGHCIDIRFKTHKEAQEWGVKYLNIRVWRRIYRKKSTHDNSTHDKNSTHQKDKDDELNNWDKNLMVKFIKQRGLEKDLMEFIKKHHLRRIKNGRR